MPTTTAPDNTSTSNSPGARPYATVTLTERAQICALLHATQYPPITGWDPLQLLRLAEASLTARSITDLPADLQPDVRAALTAAQDARTQHTGA